MTARDRWAVLGASVSQLEALGPPRPLRSRRASHSARQAGSVLSLQQRDLFRDAATPFGLFRQVDIDRYRLWQYSADVSGVFGITVTQCVY